MTNKALTKHTNNYSYIRKSDGRLDSELSNTPFDFKDVSVTMHMSEKLKYSAVG